MPKLVHRAPSYRLHKATGQAIVTLSGRDHYLGPYKSAASKKEYARLIAQWTACDGVIAHQQADVLTIVELLAAFWRHAKTYYIDQDRRPTSELKNFGTLIKRFRKAWGDTRAAEFGPLKLKAFRQTLVDEKLSRNVINRTISRVRQIFTWGVANELVPARVVQELKCLAGLRYGKCQAQETEPIRPVPDAFVDATLLYLSPQVRAIVELQRITGMRSGEVCRMRVSDLNTAGSVWTYTPLRHKTAFRGYSRIVYLGPKAQAIIRPWLRTDLEAYLFSPSEADQWRREQRRAARKTKPTYGNGPGTNRKRRPRKTPGEFYTTGSYLRAVKYAIEKCNTDRREKGDAEIPSWHPHQLRHNHATNVKREHGLEVARVLLGHKHASMTDMYAEVDRERAIAVVAKIG